MPVMRGNSSGVRPGFIGQFAFDDNNPAWIDCDGRDLNVTDEPALFAAIGYTWGGAGAVFKAPAMVDDFARGAGPGRPVGTREVDAFQGHEHSTPEGSAEGDSSSNFTNGGWTSGAVVTTNITTKAGFSAPRTADETRPRNVAVKFRIKR